MKRISLEDARVCRRAVSEMVLRTLHFCRAAGIFF
jgi:hypothetical protein